MHFTDSDANSGTRMAHFQTTWDLLRPRLSNPRTRKLPMTSAITDCMNFHNFKKGCFFFFGLNLVLSLNVVDWCHFTQMMDVLFWNPSSHIFHVIEKKPGDAAWIQYGRQWRKSSTKTFKLLLWHEGLCNFVNHLLLKTFLQHWILMSDAIRRYEKIPVSAEMGDM